MLDPPLLLLLFLLPCLLLRRYEARKLRTPSRCRHLCCWSLTRCPKNPRISLSFPFFVFPLPRLFLVLSSRKNVFVSLSLASILHPWQVGDTYATLATSAAGDLRCWRVDVRFVGNPAVGIHTGRERPSGMQPRLVGGWNPWRSLGVGLSRGRGVVGVSPVAVSGGAR